MNPTLLFLGLLLISIALLAGVLFLPGFKKKKNIINNKPIQVSTSKKSSNTNRLTTGLAQWQPSHEFYTSIRKELNKTIVGQNELVKAIVISLLTPGHILVEGVPGLAKTLTLSSLSKVLGLKSSRVQCTPDMLPMDITGNEIYNPVQQEFEIKHGPIMTNVLLIDEINRTTPKVQSALLEAMQEHAVSIGGKTYPLPDPFFVMATQNPVDSEGTYTLPHAQADRFLAKIIIDYPSVGEEEKMLTASTRLDFLQTITSKETIKELQRQTAFISTPPSIIHKLAALASFTRSYGKMVQFGISPRGTKALLHAAKAVALLSGRGEIERQDIEILILPVRNHRLLLNYDGKTSGYRTNDALLDIYSTFSAHN